MKKQLLALLAIFVASNVLAAPANENAPGHIKKEVGVKRAKEFAPGHEKSRAKSAKEVAPGHLKERRHALRKRRKQKRPEAPPVPPPIPR